jgi:hypothetical protein
VTTPTVTETRRAGQTNQPVELARYTVTGVGERIIQGQRVLGVVRLVDAPASGEGRRYVIERELTTMAELEALVADYLRESQMWDAILVVCLLRGGFSRVEQTLLEGGRGASVIQQRMELWESPLVFDMPPGGAPSRRGAQVGRTDGAIHPRSVARVPGVAAREPLRQPVVHRVAGP